MSVTPLRPLLRRRAGHGRHAEFHPGRHLSPLAGERVWNRVGLGRLAGDRWSSQIEGAKAPEGKARQGKLADVIADIFPAAATRNFSATAGQETPESRSERTGAFNAMPNFEVKKHGPMPVRRWLPVDANIQTIRRWHVDAKTGKFVKLDTEVKSNPVDTPEWALLKKARGLGLLQITPRAAMRSTRLQVSRTSGSKGSRRPWRIPDYSIGSRKRSRRTRPAERRRTNSPSSKARSQRRRLRQGLLGQAEPRSSWALAGPERKTESRTC